MKNLTEFTNTFYEAASNEKGKEYLEVVKNKLPELSAEIADVTGLKADDITFEISAARNGNLSLESNDLKEFFGPLGKAMYKEIKLITWQGNVMEQKDKKYIYFSPKWDFSYLGGGSNGTDAIWYNILFNITDNVWVFGNKLRD